VKLVHLVGFITKFFVTMHGHMNVNFFESILQFASSHKFYSCRNFCGNDLHIAVKLNKFIKSAEVIFAGPRWPRGLRRGPAVARWLGLRVRIPLGAWFLL